MYFWNIERLKSDLVREQVSERDIFLYMITWIWLPFVTSAPSLASAGAGNPSSLDYWLAALLHLIGLSWAFLAQGGGLGPDCPRRILSVGWVVAVRINLVLIPLGVAIGCVTAKPFGVNGPVPSTMVLVSQATLILYYWRLGVHLKDLGARLQL